MNDLYFGSGASASKDYESLYGLMRICLESGICHFDTAPSYQTEGVIGKVLQNLQQELHIDRKAYIIQTKIDPWQMMEGNIRRHIEAALGKLRVDHIDSLLIHWPEPDYLDPTWKEIVQAQREGLVKRIGICNVRMRQLRKLVHCTTLPQIVQIERNPLRICKEEIDFCHEYQIEVQAYSPLCKMDARIKNSKVLKDIAEKYGKNVGQIVLRWHLDTGVIPIFTTKKIGRIKEYTELYNFRLTDPEIEEISELNENYKMYLESCICPGF